jgi:predicted  nucleic acid-binding Zn-ribbon protein
MKSKTLASVVAVALVAALAAPVAAYALPGMGRLGQPKSANETTKQARFDQRLAMLKQRITMVLTNRNRGFDAAAAAILARADRVSAIADKVGKLGGDVSSVSASIDKARKLVADAKAAEAAAAELFKAVPTATDKRAAFGAAKAQARVARQTLHEARLTLRKAILDLRAVVNGLKGTVQ